MTLLQFFKTLKKGMYASTDLVYSLSDLDDSARIEIDADNEYSFDTQWVCIGSVKEILDAKIKWHESRRKDEFDPAFIDDYIDSVA